MKNCLNNPIPEIYDASKYLDAAISAHLSGNADLAELLISISDIDAIRNWTESIWGANSPYSEIQKKIGNPRTLPKNERITMRMPNKQEKALIHKRDGNHCRFCGIPVIRKEVRVFLKNIYPESLNWGKTNLSQHSAFQAMWLQYDHLIPHARGGDNSLSNIVITCAPCNYGRMNYLIEEMGINNPFDRQPIQSTWDGLERILKRT